MHVEHASICTLIDKSLAGAASVQEEQAVREHLLTCDPCRKYADDSRRAITALDGFRFDLDEPPAASQLEARTMARLTARAQQLETQGSDRRSLVWSACIAFGLTIAGSLAASELGGRIAAHLHLAPLPMQFGLAAFWIAPSLCVCLLLLVLNLAPTAWAHQKGLPL